jgi:hypothetical protein
MSMTVEHINFIDAILFLPVPLQKLAGTYGQSAAKSLYTYYSIIEENLNYVGAMRVVSYCGGNEFSDAKSIEFHEWYEG